ncbi:FKBP-type peptidyl-prolyl cis-trans isomerase [Endozoicomonas lisbonensis]|uniref:Peptidyl-prolyl cis-trans isomerase n=1 Tax=Endozoicomonas lisbonensis TaxID=3120522 RepID=A0ABV2SCU7_9GAMM
MKIDHTIPSAVVFLWLAATVCLCFANEDSNIKSGFNSVTQVIPVDCNVKVKDGDIIKAHYNGYLLLTDSTIKIDSSYERGKTFNFRLGSERVIKGFIYGFSDMCLGEKRLITIPPELAYGEIGIPGRIPANSTLLFEIELVEILQPDTTSQYIR